jgi:hypothetical protein
MCRELVRTGRGGNQRAKLALSLSHFHCKSIDAMQILRVVGQQRVRSFTTATLPDEKRVVDSLGIFSSLQRQPPNQYVHTPAAGVSCMRFSCMQHPILRDNIA